MRFPTCLPVAPSVMEATVALDIIIIGYFRPTIFLDFDKLVPEENKHSNILLLHKKECAECLGDKMLHCILLLLDTSDQINISTHSTV